MQRVDKEVFGFPYIAIAVPLFNDNNQVVGSVSFAETVDRQDMLLKRSTTAAKSL